MLDCVIWQVLAPRRLSRTQRGYWATAEGLGQPGMLPKSWLSLLHGVGDVRNQRQTTFGGIPLLFYRFRSLTLEI